MDDPRELLRDVAERLDDDVLEPEPRRVRAAGGGMRLVDRAI